MNNVIALGEMGMINSLQRLALISHNLANANTHGYRREIPVSEPFALRLDNYFEATTGRIKPDLLEQAATATKSVLDMAAGTLRNTGNVLDIAIEGSGFFEFASAEGMFYGRQGVFNQDAAGNLVTADGKSVQGTGGAIRLGSGELRVDREGVIWIDGKGVGQLKLVHFVDPSKLEKAGKNYFRQGQAKFIEDSQVSSLRQGYVEDSNVDVMSEMMGMMTTMRHFELTQRVVKGYDDIIGTAIETIGEF